MSEYNLRSATRSRRSGGDSSLAQSSTASASQTQTITDASSLPHIGGIATLRLRGAHHPRDNSPETRRPAIRWAEDVIDNEGLGRKRSKGLQRNSRSLHYDLSSAFFFLLSFLTQI